MLNTMEIRINIFDGEYKRNCVTKQKTGDTAFNVSEVFKVTNL